jgi:hypothetical protein
MDIVRLLVRVSILALFSLAAIVVMTVLFGAQMRFDRLAEIEIRGLAAPSTAPARIVTVGGGDTAHAQKLLPPPTTETLSLIQRGSDDHRVNAAQQVGVSGPVKTEPTPADDSQFVSVRVNRPGAAPSIHRVPKER